MSVYICRCCLTVISDVRHSPAETTSSGYQRRAYDLLTCTNPQCALNWQTFTYPGYEQIDLTPYHASEHPDYQQAINAPLPDVVTSR